jgi:hypothetical protein
MTSDILAKGGVEGSNPFARSRVLNEISRLERPSAASPARSAAAGKHGGSLCGCELQRRPSVCARGSAQENLFHDWGLEGHGVQKAAVAKPLQEACQGWGRGFESNPRRKYPSRIAKKSLGASSILALFWSPPMRRPSDVSSLG